MTTNTARPTVESAARWGLAVGGIFLLAVLLYFARSHTESLRVFAGTLVYPLLSVTVLSGLGYYIATHRLSVAEMWTVLQWVALGLIVMGSVVAWYQVLDSIHDHQIPLVIIALATLSIGGAMGALVGWYNVRARNNIQAATAAREREVYLERQRETLALIDRTLRHHLLNGLSIVDAHSQVLETKIQDEGRNHLDTVRTQTDEMISTIEDIRDVSETVYEQDSVKRIDVADAVRTELDAAADAHPTATFELRAAPDCLDVEGNQLLSNAISNLLHNAVQHNDAGTPHVAVTVADDGDTARVSVHDNGPGLPADTRERVFEMGERGRESDGTGMGLFIARTVVERLGGTIRVDDEEESSGTTIVFEVPTWGGETA